MSWVLLGAQVAEATPATFAADIPIGLNVGVQLDSSNCTNSTSKVTLSGDIDVLTGLSVKVRFRIPSDQKLQERTSTASTTLGIPPGTTLETPGKGLDGAGGNPWILVDFPDDQGNFDGAYYAVGRCVQGLNYGLAKRLNIDALQSGLSQSLSCAKTGSRIAMNGDNSPNGGVDVKVALANKITDTGNSDSNGTHLYAPSDGTANATFRVTLLQPDNLKGSKGWSADGLGGNPLVRAAFGKVDEQGNITYPAIDATGTWKWSTERRCKDLA